MRITSDFLSTCFQRIRQLHLASLYIYKLMPHLALWDCVHFQFLDSLYNTTVVYLKHSCRMHTHYKYPYIFNEPANNVALTL